MSPTISSQVSVSIWNLVVHQCIIDEGESTYVMSTFIWKKLGSPTLQPSTTSLRTYDGFSTKVLVIFTNVLIELASKMVLIDIEVPNLITTSFLDVVTCMP